MNNITIGGFDRQRRRAFAYYETVGGGAGGSPQANGLDGLHTHMTNTLNTPVEALEMSYPFRVNEYSVRLGSGGEGRHAGGNGIVRRWEFLAPADVTLLTERRRLRPWGLAGGGPGARGRNLLVRKGEAAVALPGKTRIKVAPGDSLVMETPGGGGWGPPSGTDSPA